MVSMNACASGSCSQSAGAGRSEIARDSTVTTDWTSDSSACAPARADSGATASAATTRVAKRAGRNVTWVLSVKLVLDESGDVGHRDRRRGRVAAALVLRLAFLEPPVA